MFKHSRRSAAVIGFAAATLFSLMAGCDATSILQEAASTQLQSALTDFSNEMIARIVSNLFGLS